LVAIRADGSIALGAILGSLVRDPRQVPQLMRTANDARAAFVALFRGRKTLDEALGFTDFSESLLDLLAEDIFGGTLPV
jgi:adenosylhomocysteine nucleosidase